MIVEFGEQKRINDHEENNFLVVVYLNSNKLPKLFISNHCV